MTRQAEIKTKEIEDVPRKLSYEGPSRAMRGCCCRQRIGFSSEIETVRNTPRVRLMLRVARGLASRQRVGDNVGVESGKEVEYL